MFKKILCLLMVAMVFCSIGVINSKPVFLGKAERFELYVGSNSSTAEIVCVDASDYSFIKDVKGESFKTSDKNFNVESFFDEYKADLVFVEEVNGVRSYYGYSTKIRYGKIINGKRINVHVAIAQNEITVGTPIIYGSF